MFSCPLCSQDLYCEGSAVVPHAVFMLYTPSDINILVVYI